jgi:aspartyl-tRNA(Asn)/glutamyl-tRNA(Gln) amidotransferase subunit A
LTHLATALRARKISCLELIEEAVDKIARLNPKLNAFITVTGDQARARAAGLDAELARGHDRGPLHGIPIAHKDLIRTKGVPTTAGSKIFADYIPKRDADVAAKLREAGAISVGKTGLHEFAYGITSTNPHFGAIRNPWNLQRIPGGSSGGSAVAVAVGMVPFATGTDTGGSIRIPASFCGVVGLKPTFGRISTRGVLPLGFSQDHVGPITRTVRDCAVAFQAMVSDPSSYVPGQEVNIRDIRVGVPGNYFFERIDPSVRAAVHDALDKVASLGAIVQEIEAPGMELVREAGATCLLVEAAAALKPWSHQRENFGEDIRGYLDRGNAITGVEYLEARRTRNRMLRKFNELWKSVDCIFTPTCPITAPRIGQSSVQVGVSAEEIRAAATRFTRPFNALGLPAISIPCGFSPEDLPIGLQIIAPALQEDRLLRVAAAMEDALGLAGRAPPVS